MRRLNTIAKSEILLGDCLTVMDELPAYAFRLIVTDPPYLFTKKNGTDEGTQSSRFSSSPLYDYSQREEVCLLKMRYGKGECFAWLDKTPRLMRKYDAYIFCSEEQIGIYQEWAVLHGYKCSVLVWEKPAAIISKRRWCQNVEFIVRIYENGTGLNRSEENALYNRVLRYPPIRKKKHPTEKPVEMFAHFIRLSSAEGDAILDPFLGSGTTYEAALLLGRLCVGIERYEPYFNVAVKRAAESENKISIQ